jgi:allantoinase
MAGKLLEKIEEDKETTRWSSSSSSELVNRSRKRTSTGPLPASKPYRNAGDQLRSMKESPQYTRYALSAFMHVVSLGIIIHMMYAGGVLDLMGSYYTSLAPWVKPCGLLDSKDFVILSENIVSSRQGLVAGGIHVRGGLIAGTFLGRKGMNESYILKHLVGGNDQKVTILDYRSSDFVVGPGFIDVHVHMNDPGRPEWETMHKATQAAAAGGVSMVVDMPLNSNPVTTTKARVVEKLKRGHMASYVQVGVWAGLVPGNAHTPGVLKSLVGAGAFGFKAFMAPSGIDDFEKVTISDIDAALPVIRDLDVPLLVHAEVVDGVGVTESKAAASSYQAWLDMRPAEMERKAVRQLIESLERLESRSSNSKEKFRVHVVHIADAEALGLIVSAKKRGLPISVETCPHYLMFSEDVIQDGATEFKCAPPIRDASNRAALRKGVLSGDIDAVSSDHSPSPESMKLKKDGDFVKAWGGISGLQYSLPALWQSLLDADAEVKPYTVHRVLSEFPAKILGLDHLKGKIHDGYHADLVVWNPKALADTSKEGSYQTQKLSPYIGSTMKGRVVATFVKGSLVFDSKVGVGARSCSTTLKKNSIRKKHRSSGSSIL